VHDLLWDQKGTALEDADLASVATAAGLDARRAMKAVASHAHRAKIEADQDAADEAQANGTPTFFINGRRLVGAKPIDEFRALIDEQLASAKDAIAHGTPAAKLYDTLMAGAKTAPPPERRAVPAPTKDNPSKGPARAKVVVQIFADFQCPFCKRALPTLDELDKAFPGKIRFVWRHLPLSIHPDAEIAAEASAEAFHQKGNAAFWKMHDLLFEGQSQPDGLARSTIERYAAQVGLNPAKLAAALDGHTHEAEIEHDVQIAKAAKIEGTPGFVINGYFLAGAQPLAKFRRVVARALQEAK
jgi:protein-disulfide isomerase